jgi:voltage-gated potassium channel
VNVYDLNENRLDEDLRQLRVRLSIATVFIVMVTIIGTVGYKILSPHTPWVDTFYMTAITLATVGYGEIVPLDGNPIGRLFTALLILVGMGATLYFVTTATAFVIEGHIGHVFRRRKMEKTIRELSGHLIVCGSGATAVYAARELLAVERKVLVICENPDRLTGLGQDLPGVAIISGDPARDSVLHAAGVDRASGLIAATDSDKENLVITLSARQILGRLRIVARVTDVESMDKLVQVGANAVVSPTHIGGLRLASELIRPKVVSFLDVMLRDQDKNLRVDEVEIPSGSTAAGKNIASLALSEVSPALLLACRHSDGTWEYNPKPDHEVRVGSTLILMGTPGDTRAVAEHVKGNGHTASEGS